jgi:purine-binding chemotaxis protein CheW
MEGQNMQLLTFLLGGVVYGIAVADVESIENKMSTLRIPDAPQHMDGIFNLHGEIIPVYNLASRFGVVGESTNNVIVSHIGDMKIGLEVGRVKEIIEAGEKDVNFMPEIMNATQNFLRQVVSYNKALIGILDVNCLISLQEQERIRRLIENRKASEK